MVRNPDLEKRVREIGEEIYASVSAEASSIFNVRTWMGRMMDWAMKDDAFRLRLFRYVDVLPSLKSDALIVNFLKEYFSEGFEAPLIIRKGMERASRSGLATYAAAKVIRSGVQAIAGQFIAGEKPEDAMRSLNELWRKGFAFSADLLGEVVVSEKEAKEYAGRYLRLLDYLGTEVKDLDEDPLIEQDDAGPIPRIDISIKVSSLYSQLDPTDWEGSIERTKENLRPIFRKAKESGASICLDMEHYYYKDIIIEIFKSIVGEFKDYRFAGIAIQAYLKEAKEDLLKLLSWAKEKERRITVRLVKGAYWDYETVINRQKGWPVPVFESKGETDLSFEELTRVLLENRKYMRPAIATHNIRSISNTIAEAESMGLSKGSFEFQMLYGMGDPIRKALRKMGYRVRVYAPVGNLVAGMAYLVRRLLENTSNESFIRRLFAESRPFEEMMKPPGRGPKPADDHNAGEEFRNEPTIDFSRAENRERMKDALKEVKEGFGRKYPLLIGGEEVTTEEEAGSFNPSHPGEIVGRFSIAGIEEAGRAIRDARKAFDFWRRVPPGERAEYLFRAAEGMRKERCLLAALEVYEVGKTWRDADGDIAEAIDYLEYYGREMMRIGKPRLMGDYPGEVNEYSYEPRGIGVVISPWNFPLAIPAGMVSAGIVTGNCVIFKPSGLSPVTGWKLAEIFRSVGLPKGVLQFLSGPGGEVGAFLVSHSDVDFIAFTGSKDVGLRIIEQAGVTLPGQRNVKKVITEMGGKNAVIVDESADLDEAVTGVLESSLGYQGQKCSACSRVIVIGDVFEGFCDRLKGAMESVKICDPERPDAFMGPVIDKNAVERIEKYVKAGAEQGKVLLLRKADGEGYFTGPAIFADVKSDSALAQEEIFGPVLVIMRAESMGDAIALANESRYALTAGIFSRSPSSITKVKEELRAGNLYINRKITGALVGRQPFGGAGMSGVGSKAGGPDYLKQFMNPRSVSENILRRGFSSSVSSVDLR
jgi:RHH-type proline utilization regulon transcriptional repressor/proline dehydrogenase/delta 1-pyrroline-5-carboxylate dehydrogenase